MTYSRCRAGFLTVSRLRMSASCFLTRIAGHRRLSACSAKRTRRIHSSQNCGPELQLERLVRRRVKQLLDRDAPRRQAFGVMLGEEIIEHLAVRPGAVGPEIVPHQIAGFLQALLDEWQRDLRG